MGGGRGNFNLSVCRGYKQTYILNLSLALIITKISAFIQTEKFNFDVFVNVDKQDSINN